MTEWTAILEGQRRSEARRVIDEIVADVGARAPAAPGLPSGAAGIALLLAYYGEAFDRDLDDRVGALLEYTVESVARQPMSAGLHGGFTGIAWTIEHLAGADPDADSADDPNSTIDEAVALALSSPGAGDNYDLISGLVGFAIYCIERLPRPEAVANLERIVEMLEAASVERDGGITWHTPPALLPPWQRELAPNGYYNLGLAHGVPGIIGVLGKLVAAGVSRGHADRLLEGAVTWLLAQRVEGADASFGAWRIDERPDPTRTAWCYGDPGAGAALMIAARQVDELSWEQAAIELMRAAAARPRDRCGVRDAGLCHGSFGLAQIFNRFFHATGDPLFRDAALGWIDDGLERRELGTGVAGFRSYRPETDGTVNWLDEPGLLTGAAGIGLALVAACSGLAPDWDRVLLVDVEPR